MCRFPSWESRIYEVAAGGLKLPSKEKAASANEIALATGTLQPSYNSLGINISIPVYTTVKGVSSLVYISQNKKPSVVKSEYIFLLGLIREQVKSDQHLSAGILLTHLMGKKWDLVQVPVLIL